MKINNNKKKKRDYENQRYKNVKIMNINETQKC